MKPQEKQKKKFSASLQTKFQVQHFKHEGTNTQQENKQERGSQSRYSKVQTYTQASHKLGLLAYKQKRKHRQPPATSGENSRQLTSHKTQIQMLH